MVVIYLVVMENHFYCKCAAFVPIHTSVAVLAEVFASTQFPNMIKNVILAFDLFYFPGINSFTSVLCICNIMLFLIFASIGLLSLTPFTTFHPVYHYLNGHYCNDCCQRAKMIILSMRTERICSAFYGSKMCIDRKYVYAYIYIHI